MATHEFLVASFSSLLTASVHTILFERGIYPATTFFTARFHNYPVHQSRHPLVCQWIDEAVDAVRAQLFLGTVARVVIVIYSFSRHPLERFVFDVERFPVVPKREREAVMERSDGSGAIRITREREPNPADIEDFQAKNKGKAKELPKKVQIPKPEQEAQADEAHERINADMSQQFRALLSRLSFLNSQLKPLPRNCSFNIAIELKDDAPAPTVHPQPWIPVEPDLQVSGRDSDVDPDTKAVVGKKFGKELGGAKVVPLRAVDAGEMVFEVWVEEGHSKYQERKDGDEGDDDGDLGHRAVEDDDLSSVGPPSSLEDDEDDDADHDGVLG